MENTEITNVEIVEADTMPSDPVSTPAEPVKEDISEAQTEEAAPPISQPDEAALLRQELSRLQEYINDKKAKEDKALSELEEFGRLYPNVSMDTLDEAVWERVRGGLPLSAAYALCEREKELRISLAEQTNLKNTTSSAGSAGASTGIDYFSPDEVRAMSREEVRQNYSNIRRSMNYWRKASK